MSLLSLFAQSTTFTSQNTNDGGLGFGVVMLIYVAVIVFILATMWKVYQKAGRPGWAAIIPIYNTYVLIKIAGKPGWWCILYFIPIVNIIISIIISIDIAKAFGKSETFGVVGLWLFSFVGYPMLAFGDATYHGAPTESAPVA